jgi:thiamine biosynthesis protein ThiI
LLLLSGGIDSPVAGWMAMRKGLEVEAVHFHSYPYTSEQAKDKVVDLARRLTYFSGVSMKLHLVPFTEIQTTLAQSGQEHLIITLMRRAMLRITERIAESSGAGGIVTGESLGQVASQTLASMNVIGRATQQEIINIAYRIGTYETSILPFEDCCTLFLPKSPSTNPNLRVVERIEAGLVGLSDMIETAVRDTEVIKLYPNSPAAKSNNPSQEDAWF